MLSTCAPSRAPQKMTPAVDLFRRAHLVEDALESCPNRGTEQKNHGCVQLPQLRVREVKSRSDHHRTAPRSRRAKRRLGSAMDFTYRSPQPSSR